MGLVGKILFFLILIGFILMAVITAGNHKEITEFCESRGGERYSVSNCLIKEDGNLVNYDIVRTSKGLRLLE